MNHLLIVVTALTLISSGISYASSNVIEKQLEDIGSIPNDEIVVVQRKYTRKVMRHELTPIILGGVPFGTVRRTLFAGAGYTLHVNDWFAWEAFDFLYAKNFFSSFTDDINGNKKAGANPNAPDIKPDYQKLLYFVTTSLQFTPFYGKMSTFSRYIAYVEPYFTIGGGIAKTEGDPNINVSGTYFVAVPGIGLRTFFKEWFSMKVEFRDYLYTEDFTDRTTGNATSALRNNYAVMVSFSFWLPKMPR